MPKAVLSPGVPLRSTEAWLCVLWEACQESQRSGEDAALLMCTCYLCSLSMRRAGEQSLQQIHVASLKIAGKGLGCAVPPSPLDSLLPWAAKEGEG